MQNRHNLPDTVRRRLGRGYARWQPFATQSGRPSAAMAAPEARQGRGRGAGARTAICGVLAAPAAAWWQSGGGGRGLRVDAWWKARRARKGETLTVQIENGGGWVTFPLREDLL